MLTPYSLQWTDCQSRKSTRKQGLWITHWMRWTYQTHSEHFILTQQNMHSSIHGTFFRKDHILGHKSGLNWYKKTRIIPYVFSDHHAMKLEVNHKKKFWKNTDTWRLKNIQWKNEWVNQEIEEEIKKLQWDEVKMKTWQSKTRWS